MAWQIGLELDDLARKMIVTYDRKTRVWQIIGTRSRIKSIILLIMNHSRKATSF